MIEALPLVLLLAAPRFQGPVEVVERGLVSTSASEIRIAISPDGARLLWGTIGREGGPGGWDVWESVREGQAWGAAHPAGFDSPDKDFDPAFAPDGKGVYFFSNRPGGLGGDDIWFAPLDPATGAYGAAVNLGPHVNSPRDEWAPSPSPDGQRLLFSSDGRGGRGLHDLFVSRRDGAGWAEARPLPGPINSAQDDFDACWLHDGKTIVFTRKPKDRDESELFLSVERGGNTSEPRSLGPLVNAPGAWNLGPAIAPRQPGVLYFTSQRPDGPGRADVFRVRYR